MTNENASRANDTGLPELKEHISDMQRIAMRVHCLLDVVGHLENEGACGGGRMVISEIATKMAEELTNGLDSVSLPEVRA